MANLIKDARLIKDNPGKTAYELLNLGLSQAGYEGLLKEQEANVAKDIAANAEKRKEPVTKSVENDTFPDIRNKVAPTIIKEPVAAPQQQRAVPKITTGAPIDSDSQQAVLIDTTTGSRTPMQRSFAIKWATKPNHKGRYIVE